MEKSIIMKKLLLTSFLFAAACHQTPKYDCPENFCGYVVVEHRDDELILKKGCNYVTVNFPYLYENRVYKLGDTICRPDRNTC